MNKILVPVDFSESAADALRYALELNRRFFAKIILLYVFDMPKISGGEVLPELELNYKNFAKGFEDDLELFFKKYSNPDEPWMYEVHAIAGEHNESIVHFAEQEDADLIVLGRKGVAGLRRLIFGSVSKYVLTHATMPVIVVPAGEAYKGIDKILLATDFNEELSEKNYQFLSGFTNMFDARLEILHVVNGEVFRNEKSESVFRFLQLQFHKNPHLIKVRGNEDVIGAIEKFSAENNISLLVTIPHDHDWLESLISSSHTEKLLHMLDRPLMSLPHSKKAYIPGEDEIKYTSMPGSKYYY